MSPVSRVGGAGVRSLPGGDLLGRAVVVAARTSGPNRVGVPRTYLAALAEVGLPVLVVTDPALGTDLLARAGGLLLPGGADVDPARYGAAAHTSTRVEPDLDDLELALVRAALDLGRPTLAICRGQQVLNVALGGTLVQDLPTERPNGLVHTPTVVGDGDEREIIDAAHDVTIAPGSLLGDLLGGRAAVNSAHHQAVDELGEGLVAVAWSGDGTIEAVELEDPGGRFLLGVQFHPERWSDEVRRPIFTRFADAI